MKLNVKEMNKRCNNIHDLCLVIKNFTDDNDGLDEVTSDALFDAIGYLSDYKQLLQALIEKSEIEI